MRAASNNWIASIPRFDQTIHAASGAKAGSSSFQSPFSHAQSQARLTSSTEMSFNAVVPSSLGDTIERSVSPSLPKKCVPCRWAISSACAEAHNSSANNSATKGWIEYVSGFEVPDCRSADRTKVASDVVVDPAMSLALSNENAAEKQASRCSSCCSASSLSAMVAFSMSRTPSCRAASTGPTSRFPRSCNAWRICPESSTSPQDAASLIANGEPPSRVQIS